MTNPITKGVMSRLIPVMGMGLKIRSGKTKEITKPAPMPVTSKMNTIQQPIFVADPVASVADSMASVVASVADPKASVVASVADPKASVVTSIASPVFSGDSGDEVTQQAENAADDPLQKNFEDKWA